jgi:hypothetical protein
MGPESMIMRPKSGTETRYDSQTGPGPWDQLEHRLVVSSDELWLFVPNPKSHGLRFANKGLRLEPYDTEPLRLRVIARTSFVLRNFSIPGIPISP